MGVSDICYLRRVRSSDQIQPVRPSVVRTLV